MQKTRFLPKGQYAITSSIVEVAKAMHLRPDDVAYTLLELGFLRHRRGADGETAADDDELGDWKGVEVVVTREMVEGAWEKWRVREKPLLNEASVLL